MTPARRRGASPDAGDLAALGQAPAGGGRLRKAPPTDPVLGLASPSSVSTPDSAPAEPLTATRRAVQTAGEKAKVGFYQRPGDTARARAAYDWTRAQTRHRSFSDFIADAIMREVERLEVEYNHGQPWPPMEPGELPTGKPLGA
jgi:Centromere-binding protein ParB C-terminal